VLNCLQLAGASFNTPNHTHTHTQEDKRRHTGVTKTISIPKISIPLPLLYRMSHDKKMLDREAVRSVIQQWNANRLDLFALSEPDEVRIWQKGVQQ